MIKTEIDATEEDVIVTVRIPKFYIDEDVRNRWLKYSVLLKLDLDGKTVNYMAPMLIDTDILYPDK